MTRYRMAAYASVCFDVKAASAEEAVKVAQQIVDENCNGLDVPIGEHGRLYLDENETPTVEDVDD
jgi:hypothetical protein